MGASNLTSVLLLFVTALTLTGLAYAGSSRQDFLDAHNAVRASVGVGPVSWNESVEAYAENYVRAGDCRLVSDPDGPYGENIYKGTGNATEVVGLWTESKQYYDYKSNSCAPDQFCGDYTQVVWAKSVSIGCFTVACTFSEPASLVACGYYPPGNIPGERPY